MDPGHFRRLACYNRWANRRLYAACGSLAPGAYFAPRSGFFPSLHKTLNHILAADRIWLGRIEGRPSAVLALDQILYPDFPTLAAAREDEDERIIRLVEDLTPQRLGEDLAYRTMAGEPQTTPLHLVLTHVFNHQTHHRGQAHAMLSGTDAAPPPLDLILFLREAG
ncbi:MAG: damage-inducible protein DinB [Rhodospirillaceae bacterium]|nr:damage-inducible protein DinB [Rhodospirillaceae bacterium]